MLLRNMLTLRCCTSVRRRTHLPAGQMLCHCIERETRDVFTALPSGEGSACCCLSRNRGLLPWWLARRMQHKHSLSKSENTDQGGSASLNRLPGSSGRRSISDSMFARTCDSLSLREQRTKIRSVITGYVSSADQIVAAE